MRIIMLSWEYPPKIVGGISRHLYDLAHALQAQGVEVHVVTCSHPGAAEEAVEDGIHLHRVTPSSSGNDFIHWVQLLNDAMYSRAEPLIAGLLAMDPDGPIVLHAHDWLAHFSGAALKHKFRLPLVATIHATEYGRNHGIHGPTQQYINSVERALQHEAWRVIVCTEFMKRECEYALSAPWDKMDVIYNGVDAGKFVLPNFSYEERNAFRARYAAPWEKLVFFVGRMVREKGVQVLIEALPKVKAGYNHCKLLIVGGGYRDHLVSLTRALGVERSVYFAGFVPDDDLMKIYSIIDVAVFPSLYEPFGIVALEAMAANVPVVVSDAGGLPEVVLNGVTGTTTYAGNPNSLADGLLNVLLSPDKARAMADSAYDRLMSQFNWPRIAAQTVDVYTRVWTEYLDADWSLRRIERVPDPLPAPEPEAVVMAPEPDVAEPVAVAAAPEEAAPAKKPRVPRATRTTSPKETAEPAPKATSTRTSAAAKAAAAGAPTPVEKPPRKAATRKADAKATDA